MAGLHRTLKGRLTPAQLIVADDIVRSASEAGSTHMSESSDAGKPTTGYMMGSPLRGDSNRPTSTFTANERRDFLRMIRTSFDKYDISGMGEIDAWDVNNALEEVGRPRLADEQIFDLIRTPNDEETSTVSFAMFMQVKNSDNFDGWFQVTMIADVRTGKGIDPGNAQPREQNEAAGARRPRARLGGGRGEPRFDGHDRHRQNQGHPRLV